MRKIKIIRFSENLWICELSLPWLASQILNEDARDYKRQKNIYFSKNIINNTQFNENEISKINGFKTLKKQIEWIGGRSCVKKLAKLILGQDENETEVAQKEKGAPYIINKKDIHISISHSGNYAMSLIYLGNDRAAIDIETIKSRNIDSIKKVALTDEENSEFKGNLEAIIKLFTIKEAYLKYIEEGFHESLKNVEVLMGKLYHNRKHLQHLDFFSYRVDESHIATIIYPKSEKLNQTDIEHLELI